MPEVGGQIQFNTLDEAIARLGLDLPVGRNGATSRVPLTLPSSRAGSAGPPSRPTSTATAVSPGGDEDNEEVSRQVYGPEADYQDGGRAEVNIRLSLPLSSLRRLFDVSR